VFEPTALRVGDTLDAFLPRKPTINKIPSGIEIEGVEYLAVTDLTKEQKEENLTVQDVVILGEVTANRTPILYTTLIAVCNRDILRGDNSAFLVV